MRIGIDISQLAYEGTGVAEYMRRLVENLLKIDRENEYVLFYSSLRRKIANCKLPVSPAGGQITELANVELKEYPLPPTLLDLLWNRLHIFPVEWFVGDVDVFISSDWTQPPAKRAKLVTFINDMIVYKYAEETHPKTKVYWKELLVSPNIVAVQKRRLRWVARECDRVICISRATKQDVKDLLNIEEKRLSVVYPGVG